MLMWTLVSKLSWPSVVPLASMSSEGVPQLASELAWTLASTVSMLAGLASQVSPVVVWSLASVLL